MKALIALSIFSVILPQFSSADETKALHQIINKYRNAPTVIMKMKKTVSMKLLGETKTSSGKLYLSSNKMRYIIDNPEQHLIVMNNDSIWIENRLPKKLGGKIQVTHLKSKSGQNKVKGFLAAFFGNQNIDDDMAFELIKNGDYNIKFKKKSLVKDLKSAKIGVSLASTEIKYIEYTDKLNNVTRHNFTSVEFKKEKNKSKYQYSPPKNAEVTVM